MAGSPQAAERTAPAPRPVPEPALRVGFERTVLELDSGGSARAARGLRAGLQSVHGLQMIDLEQPAGRARGRVARGLVRELRYLPHELPRRARDLDLDVLHCPAALLPAHSAVPVVVTVNDTLAWDRPRWIGSANLAQQRLVAARAVRAAQRVITPSAFSRQRIAARLGVAPGRISVVPYGIDARFGPGPPDPLTLERLGLHPGFVLCVGALGPRKNLGRAIAAFERAADGLGDAQLAIVGAPGRDARRLARQVARSPVRDRVRVLGRVSDDALLSLYRGARCLLFPSLYEGFGFPPLEAMACGLPVIASADGPMRETVGEAGILVDVGDTAALAAALRTVQGRGRELAVAGSERARRYTWDRCSAAIAEIYAQAARG